VLDQVTPLLITYNEALNLRRTLAKLAWAKRIVVIDSGSRDETLEILRAWPQAEVFHRPFTDFASQCNFGLTQVSTPWVLSIDADYELSDELIDEVKSLKPNDEVAGYRVGFVYRVYGRPLRGSLYPPRTVLYRAPDAAYQNEGHGHRVLVRGQVISLSGRIFHDDRKPLSHWFAAQKRYVHIEANHLLNCNRPELSTVDRLRLLAWPSPIGAAIYTLFAKGCLFDGWAGWFYVLQRITVETMIVLEILDQRMRRLCEPDKT
jgi:glycosyltransferase involved in cell wall biosynthesis